MKKLLWPLVIVLLALGAIGVLLISQPTALNPVLPEEVTPSPGGIYTEGLIGSLNRLNPVLDFYHTTDHDIDSLIFSGLIHFDDYGLPVGDLAESWGTSVDGKVYNFSIRPDAVWHDGEPVTSADVAFTIDLMREEGSPLTGDVRELWNQVEVKLLGDSMIQFRLPEPFAPFFDYLSFGILPQHLLGDLSLAQVIESPFNLQPVGSGPYRYDSLITENGEIKGIVLKAFDDYYADKPFIQEFVFRIYPDSQSLLSAYQSGEIMGMGQVTADILPEVLKEPNLEIHSGRLPQLTMVFLNLDNSQVEFLKDASIRRAMLMGLNRQWYIDHLLQGQAMIADGPIFPGTWAYYDGVNKIRFDQPAALELIKEAGYSVPAEGGNVRVNEDGVRLELELVYPDTPEYEAIAQAIQKDWQKLGMGVTITPLSYDELVNNALVTHAYQAALVDINLASSPDPDPYPFWHQTQVSSGQNYSQWVDLQASEYLERARIVADRAERISNYKNFQVRFSQELPSLPLYYPVYTYAVDSKVRGVSTGPLFDYSDRFASVTSWFLSEERARVLEVTRIAPTPTP